MSLAQNTKAREVNGHLAGFGVSGGASRFSRY
jgi:hypothetical protein